MAKPTSNYVCKNVDPPDDSLSAVNKEIFEIKKKIQLSEGQRKALFEASETERKSNSDTILRLKREIAELLSQLKAAKGYVDISKISCRLVKGLPPLADQTYEKTKEVLDLKIIDLKKRLDLLKYEVKKKDKHLKSLIEKYQKLMDRPQLKQSKKREKLPVDHPLSKKIVQLENEVHRMEIQCGEGVLLQKKYRGIKDNLILDSVRFENSLQRLEEAIKQQQKEIDHLEKINAEAICMRDEVLKVLETEQQEALTTSKERELKLNESRLRVQKRRQELQHLERRIVLQSARGVQRPSSDVSDAGESDSDEDVVANDNAVMAKSFEKLKEATGAMGTTEVLERFQTQKETLERLMQLRRKAEDEKDVLERRKQKMTDEVELFKFAEDKDKERAAEDMERLTSQIKFQNNRFQELEDTYKNHMEIFHTISQVLYSLCVALRCTQDTETGEFVEEPPAKPTSAEDLLKILTERLMIAYMQSENDHDSVVCDGEITSKTGEDATPNETPRTTGESGVCPPSYTTLNAKSPVSVMGIHNIVASSSQAALTGSEDEEEVPSRGYLKRQAQLIVDAKSRRKTFRIQLPTRK